MRDAMNHSQETTEMSQSRPGRRLFMKQPAMLRMLYALSPLFLTGIYFFGWRVAAVVAVVFITGLGTEFIMSRRRGAAVSMACLVTCALYGLSLPPTVPYWIAAVGAVVAILFGKEVFGGFGRNFANPAIVGRAFVYVCFPIPLTAQFVPAFKGFPGGFAQWSMEHFVRATGHLPEYLSSAGQQITDAVTQASPMFVSGKFGTETAAEAVSLWDMMIGNIGGVFTTEGGVRIMAAGSIGEGCGLLVILCGVYLLISRTANWRLMLSPLVGVGFATVLFRHLLGFDGLGEVPAFTFTIFAGTTLYASIFMVTEPVTAPKMKVAKLVYGFLIGFLIVLIRWKGIFVAAASFSILLGNIVAPLLDLGVAAVKERGVKKVAKEEVGES